MNIQGKMITLAAMACLSLQLSGAAQQEKTLTADDAKLIQDRFKIINNTDRTVWAAPYSKPKGRGQNQQMSDEDTGRYTEHQVASGRSKMATRPAEKGRLSRTNERLLIVLNNETDFELPDQYASLTQYKNDNLDIEAHEVDFGKKNRAWDILTISGEDGNYTIETDRVEIE